MEPQVYSASQTIEKETITSLNFPNEDVLETKKQKENRTKKLFTALRLGNLEHHKVMIDFKDAVNFHRVHTTIWSLTERFAILKSNRRIPINRILDVKIN